MAATTTAASTEASEPIAIVGLACHFPGGVTDPESYWRLLRDGVDAIREIDREGLDPDRFYDPRPRTPGRMATRWAGLLDGIDRFDAAFFGISPREAQTVSPEQRLLLETVWEAYEDAGIDVTALAGDPVGVYVGQWVSDYEDRLFADLDHLSLHGTTGTGRYASSGRLSYVFDLTGPSMTLDTACSSSLVAVHLACQSLRGRESTMAVAAGVNVLLEPAISVAYSQGSMMALDGRCKFGDAAGDGYVRSEGVGVVLLERLDDALAAGHPIRAVVRGSAVNNDGHGTGRMSRPSVRGQAAVLRSAYRDAGVDPATVGYVEAHGTGTRAGDPVEITALAEVFGLTEGSAARTTPTRLGSVKTNIGHAEGAAGVAGLIKCVLMLEHQEIPASLHFAEPNPDIPWDEIPFEIPVDLETWATEGDAPRRAGVTAFGITGTNAHVVVEEAPRRGTGPERTTPAEVPLVLSAATPAALSEMARSYADLLETVDADALYDVAACAARHRATLEHAAVFVVGAAADAAARLRRFAAGDNGAAAATGRALERGDLKVAFVFPGQGGQWAGMGRDLLATDAAFADAIDRCDAALPAGIDWRVREQLECAGTATSRLGDIAVLQPTLLALQIALAATWRSWGVEPAAVVGHSMGEVGAAYLAGAMTLDEAMLVIVRRSALMARAAGAGAMAFLELSREESTSRIAPFAGRVVVAAENSPRSTVVSGDRDDIAALLAGCERDGVFARAIKVDVASHSPHMDPFVEELIAGAAVSPTAATLDLYSTVDAAPRPGALWDADYWGRNLRRAVRFGPTVERMLADGVEAIVELSPHPTLLPAIGQIDGGPRPALAVGSLRRDVADRTAMLAGLGALWAGGHQVDWSLQFPTGTYRHVRLPHYPWQRARHWVDAASPVAAGASRQTARPLDPQAADWLLHPSWEPSPAPMSARLDGRWVVVGDDHEAATAMGRALDSLGATSELVATVEGAVSAGAGATGMVVLPASLGSDRPFAPVDAIQILDRIDGAGGPRVWWLTHGAAHLAGDRPFARAADAAAFAAAVRVAGVEQPDRWGGVIDLDPDESVIGQLETAARAIAAGDGEDSVALRAGAVRHVKRILPAVAPPIRHDDVWRDDRAYLVTGGLGGIAEHITLAMARSGARRLVLLGRSGLPPRSEWARVPESSEVGRRIAAVRALEHAGSSVHVVVANVGDEAQVRAALDGYAAEGWPPIAGVVHAAGIVEHRLVRELTPSSFDAVLAPKLRGAQILDELLPDLDLFVVFSSFASFWPGAGLTAYAAANAGLDALAEQRHARGRHALSVQWGPWPSVGMYDAAVPGSSVDALRVAGLGAIAPEQGSAWFERLLSETSPVASVLPIDWPAFHAAFRGRVPALFRSTPGSQQSPSGSGSVAAGLAAADDTARRAMLVALVREAAASVLRLPAAELDAQRPFGALGLDSLMAIELRNRLEMALERPLSATLAWNHPTVEALAAHLDELVNRPAAAETVQDVAASDAPARAPHAEALDATPVATISSLSDDEVLQALRGGR